MSRKRRRYISASSCQPQPSRRLHISPAALDGWGNGGGMSAPGVPLTMAEVQQRYAPPLTLGAPEDVRVACDHQLAESGVYSLLQHSIALGQMPQAQFLGYAALQQISQNALIRACVETVTDDMTRNWISLKRTGAAGKAGKTERVEYLERMGLTDTDANADAAAQLAQIASELDNLHLQQIFHDAAALVGYMGGCLIFIDTGASGEDLTLPLHIGQASAELQADRPLRFVPVDPVNVFPGIYNSLSPLREDYFRPRTWWVLGQEVHHTRLLRLVANEVPVLLKPAYNFLGIAQAQILLDYVMHFQDCRLSSQRLLGKFSLTVMKSDSYGAWLDEGAREEIDRRVMALVQHRSNDGVLLIDKEHEDVVKLETPIGGVTDIVRQSLEILAAVNRTPAVKLLGISPSGFNATGESDIRNYYDHIKSQQEKLLRSALETVLKILQIRLFGEIDESITFDFAPLSEADQAAEANTQKVRADTMAVLLDRNVVSPEECRLALANDPDSIFPDIDAEELPDPPEDEMGEGMGGEPEPGAGRVDDVDKAGAVYDANSNFEEGDHPRDANGQFASGAGGEGSRSAAKQESDSDRERQKAIQAKIDSIRIEPGKDNVLPNLNEDTLEKLGKPDKPVLLKKGVIERNAGTHSDVPLEESSRLIGEALYNPVHVLRGNAEKDYLNFIGIDKTRHGVVLLDVEEAKDNFEIVHWHYVDIRGVGKLQRKAERIEKQSSEEGQA